MSEPRLNEHRLEKVLGGQWRLYCPLKKYSREIPEPKSGVTVICWGCGAQGRLDILQCK